MLWSWGLAGVRRCIGGARARTEGRTNCRAAARLTTRRLLRSFEQLPEPPTLGPAAQALPRDKQLPPLLIINMQLPFYPVRAGPAAAATLLQLLPTPRLGGAAAAACPPARCSSPHAPAADKLVALRPASCPVRSQATLFGTNDGPGASLVYYFALPEGWEPSQVGGR